MLRIGIKFIVIIVFASLFLCTWVHAGIVEYDLTISQQEINIKRSLVGLVQNNDFVLFEIAIALGLGQQDAIGHQFDVGLWIGFVGKADLETDILPESLAEFLRNPRGDAASSDTSGLCVTNYPGTAVSCMQAELGKLRRFTRTGFPADDDHLMLVDCLDNGLSMREDR